MQTSGGGRIKQAQLKAAKLSINSKIKRKGKLSAKHIHTARELITARNIKLYNSRLRDKQIPTRQAHQPVGIMAVPAPKPGDILSQTNIRKICDKSLYG